MMKTRTLKQIFANLSVTMVALALLMKFVGTPDPAAIYPLGVALAFSILTAIVINDKNEI